MYKDISKKIESNNQLWEIIKKESKYIEENDTSSNEEIKFPVSIFNPRVFFSLFKSKEKLFLKICQFI